MRGGSFGAEPVAGVSWFYTTEDGYAGPVGSEELQDLLSSGRVTQSTLVWNETFGESWRVNRDTEIFQRKRAPPLPSTIRMEAPDGPHAQPPKKRKRLLYKAPVLPAQPRCRFFDYEVGV